MATATRARFLQTDAINAVRRMGVESITRSVAAAVSEAAQVQSRQLQAIGDVLSQRLASRTGMTEVHRDIGLAAQRSVLASYDQTVTARKTVPSYRLTSRNPANRRFAGGALRRALANPAFFEATSTGIRFGNIGLLDREAAHWHRLNFGAAPIGEGSRSRFNVTWSGLVIAALGLEDGPSPGFLIPRGYWVLGNEVVGSGTRGSAAFYPASELPSGIARRTLPSPARQSAGIEARNFLDAGIRRIAEELPAAYQDMYREWWEQATRGSGPLVGMAHAPRPAPQTVGVSRELLY